MIINSDGIQARPAALIAGALASLEAQVMIATERSAAVSARSPTALMSLGTRAGDVLRIEADGANHIGHYSCIVPRGPHRSMLGLQRPVGLTKIGRLDVCQLAMTNSSF